MFLVSAEGADNPWIDKSEYIPMLKDYLSEFSVKMAQDVIPQITDPDLVNYRPLEASHLPDPWYKNRAVVIGDGAHATVPQLGSGAALALEDGVVLAEELDKALKMSIIEAKSGSKMKSNKNTRNKKKSKKKKSKKKSKKLR